MRLIPKVAEWFDLRLQLAHSDSRDSRAPCSPRDRELVLCLRQRRAHCVLPADCHRAYCLR